MYFHESHFLLPIESFLPFSALFAFYYTGFGSTYNSYPSLWRNIDLRFTAMSPKFRISHLFLLLGYIFSSSSGIQIWVGADDLPDTDSTCGNIQEFSCIGDTCDPFDDAAHNGACRNGGARDVPCSPGQQCSSPKKDHCLENTISRAGNHSMPTSAVGTPKHFTCMNVENFDTPAIVYQTPDCGGYHCFIPGNGSYSLSFTGSSANCIVIAPPQPVLSWPCLSAGQTRNDQYPEQGGFRRDNFVYVGGDYGMPASWSYNTLSCDALSDPLPQMVLNNTAPPTGSTAYTYVSDLTGADIGNTSDLDLCGADDEGSCASGLLERNLPPPKTQYLREGELLLFHSML